MAEPEDRPLAEDFSSPVTIEPGVDDASPSGWAWRSIGTSQPNQATFHISHDDVNRVTFDFLRPSDAPAGALFAATKEIPIIILDSLDKFWASESRRALRLGGLRVPVEGDTVEEAKSALAGDLAAQLRLLLLLSGSGRANLAPELKANLEMLSAFMSPRSGLENDDGLRRDKI